MQDRIHPDEAYVGNDKFHTENPDDIKSIRDTHMKQDLRGQELRHEEIYRQAIAIRDHVDAFGRMSDDGAYAVRTYTPRGLREPQHRAARRQADPRTRRAGSRDHQRAQRAAAA